MASTHTASKRTIRGQVLAALVSLAACASPSSRDVRTFYDATNTCALSLDDVRCALPGYVFWEETRYGESDPGHPIPTVCAGASRASCEVEIVVEQRQVASIVVRSPALEGPSGARVGATHGSLASRLVDCHVGLGDAEGIFCNLEGYTNVGVELEVPGMYLTMPTSEVPTPEQLARATIARIMWHPALR